MTHTHPYIVDDYAISVHAGLMLFRIYNLIRGRAELFQIYYGTNESLIKYLEHWLQIPNS